MRDAASLDFTKLLGFAAVADKLADGINFQDETVGAKLGAKVGAEPEPTRSPKTESKLDFTRLLGFDAVADPISSGIDFKDETLGAKLGAKVGEEPS